MQLLSLKLKNFRSVADASLSELQPLSLIIGPNNSGKSAFVAALGVIRKALLGQWAISPHDVSTFARARRVVSIEGMFSFAPDEIAYCLYSLSELPLAPAARDELAKEVTRLFPQILVTVNGTPSTPDVLAAVGQKADVTLDGKNPQSWISELLASIRQRPEGIELNNPNLPNWIGPLLSNSINGLIRSKIRILGPTRRPELLAGAQAIDDFQENAEDFARALYYHRSNQTAGYETLLTLVCRVFPSVELVLSPPVGGSNQITFGIRERGVPFVLPFGATSSGITEALMILGRLAFSPEGAVITMEEPEVHFHPIAAKELLGVFMEASSSKQLLIVTHSSDFVNDIRIPMNDYWFVWREENGPTTAKRVNRERDINWMEGKLSPLGVGEST